MNEGKGLIEQGKLEYLWAKYNMPIINIIVKKYESKKPLEGFSLGVCLHITKETAVLVNGLRHLGANISLCSANPLSS